MDRDAEAVANLGSASTGCDPQASRGGSDNNAKEFLLAEEGRKPPKDELADCHPNGAGCHYRQTVEACSSVKV